jgi:ketosteroid isomerase-like protein
MSEQENVRTVREAYSSFQNGDIDGVLRVLADDVEWITPGPPELMPVAGKRRGRQEVAEFFSTLNEQEDVESFEIQEYIAQGDKVVALIKYRGRVKATGRTVEADLVHVFTFDRGKVKRFREYFDTAAVLDAYQTPKAAKAAKARPLR